MSAINLTYAQDKFLFASEDDFSRIPNIKRIKLSNGDTCWGFDDIYPQSAVTISHLKIANTVKALAPAVPRAKEIVSLPTKLNEHAFLDQYHDLFKVSPYAHQVDAILRLLYYDRLAILFEQGLGKTYIALVMHGIKQRMLGRRLKMLAVAPKIVAPNWLREAEKFTFLKGFPLYGEAGQRAKCKEAIESCNGDYDFVITTYDVLGNSKSSEKGMRASKDAKLDYWLALTPVSRDMHIGTLKRKTDITDAEVEYIKTIRSDGSQKQRNKLWSVLKKGSKLLQSKAVMDHQKGYSDLEFLKQQDFDVVVFDEASRIKNYKSSRTIAAFQLSTNVKYRYHLSGTLCNGTPADFYAPFTLLNDRLWGGWTDFEKRYLVKSKYNEHIVKGYKNLDDLKLKTEPYMFSANRADCIDLPDRTILRTPVPMDTSISDLYNSIVSTDDHLLALKVKVDGEEKNYYINTSSIAVKITKLHQLVSGFIMPTHDDEAYKVCNSCKHLVDCVSTPSSAIFPWSDACKMRDQHGITKKPEMPVIEYECSKIRRLESDLEDSSEKTIIWALYRHDLRNIRELLTSMNIKFIEAGEKDCDVKFQDDPSIKVFLGQVAQGIGITLTKATRTIYYSHGLVLEHRLQSMDRNYRIGQKEKVLVLDYYDENSIESDILFLLEYKIDVKEFLQERPLCVTCDRRKTCIETGITLYSVNCVHYHRRETAETRAGLKLSLYVGEGEDEELIKELYKKD